MIQSNIGNSLVQNDNHILDRRVREGAVREAIDRDVREVEAEK